MQNNKQKKNNAKMVISPVQKPPGQGTSKKAKQRRKQKLAVPLYSTQNMTNGHRNAFITDSSSNTLEHMLGDQAGRRRSEIYSKVNSTGISSAGISGQSGNMYLDCLVDPSRGPNRYPDEYDKATAVHQTILYGTVASGTATGLGNEKSFSMILNPFIGVAAPVNYKGATLTTWASGAAGAWTAPAIGNGYYIDPDNAQLTAITNNIRPVGASLFVSYVGDPLTSGGQLSAALIASNTLNAGATTTLDGSDLRLVSKLALQPNAYSGPLSKGAYCYWTPEDPQDMFFQPLSTANAYQFPLIVVSGNSTQPSTVVLRYAVVVNYEYTTTSRLVASLPSPIEPTLITGAKKVLQGQPRCTANDDHESWWTRVLDGARGLFTTLGNGVYSLFHPSLQLISQAASDPGLKSAINDVMQYRGGLGAISASLNSS